MNFEDAVYVVDEGSTVTVNILRGDDGGVVPINVGELTRRLLGMC